MTSVKRVSTVIAAILGLWTSNTQADTVVDLTTVGSSGQINGAWYIQTSPQPTGTGNFQPFVRIQNAPGATWESGFNTDYRPVELDTKDGNQWTHSIKVSNIPVVTYAGQLYRQFLLDINEEGNPDGKMITLDNVQIFLGATGDLHNYPFNVAPNLATMIYNMDGAPDGPLRVELNYKLNNGSGSGDMFLLVPVANFGHVDSYVYLYSHFGVPNVSDAGFEEWSVRPGSPVIVPLPPAAWAGLSLMGLLGAGKMLRRRSIADPLA